MEIDAKRQLSRMKKIAKRAHVIRQSDVAVSRLLLGPSNSGIDGNRVVIGDRPNKTQDFADCLLGTVARQDGIANYDRSGVDEGISRNAALVLELYDRVKATSRGLSPDAFPKGIPEFAERERQGKNLRNTLDREWLLGVARTL